MRRRTVVNLRHSGDMLRWVENFLDPHAAIFSSVLYLCLAPIVDSMDVNWRMDDRSLYLVI